jgi:hypothetical protein
MGALTSLRWRILISTHLWNVVTKSEPIMDIQPQLISWPSGSHAGLLTDPPTETNSTGMQAWVLAPEEFAALRKKVAAIRGMATISSARVSTLNNQQAMMTIGGTYPSAGWTVDVIPRYAAHEVRLLYGSCSTAPAATGTSGAIPQTLTLVGTPQTVPGTLTRTNFVAMCEAFIPNGGGLVLATPVSRSADATDYWMLIQTQATDHKGNILP